MKILFSLTYYTPYISGLTLYVKRLGEALVKKGYQVSVLTMNFDKKLIDQEIVKGVEVVRANYLVKVSKGFISFDWLVKSWQEAKKADVVFINLPQFEGIIPAIFGKIFGKKVISIYHCEVDLPSGFLNKLVQLGLTLSNWLTLAMSNTIVTYTKDFADYSKLIPKFRPKLSYVYPPILVPKINKSIQKILIDKFHLEGHFVVGVAARLAAEKGIEYLLEAIPLLKDNFQFSFFNFQILIAGLLDPVGEENYKRKILDLVEKYKDYVVFLGELKEEEMGSFYSLLDVLVLPSINSTESFGMAQVEAMMTGVPVVATNLPGVRIPIQKTGMGLLVPIKDSNKLAEAIVEVIINKAKFIKDKEEIKKEFSFEKTIKFYERLFSF